MTGGRRWTMTALLAVGVLLLTTAGCARSDWIEETLVTVDVTGVWRGTTGRGGSAYSGGSVDLTLQQSGPKVTGQFGVATGGAPGAIEGTVKGDRLSLWSSRGGWKAELQVNGDEMIGTEASSVGNRNLYLRREP